jgi:hypothetical protein
MGCKNRTAPDSRFVSVHELGAISRSATTYLKEYAYINRRIDYLSAQTGMNTNRARGCTILANSIPTSPSLRSWA